MSKLLHGDCLEVMSRGTPDTFDAVVTDPPYGLSFMDKEWDHGVPGAPFWGRALRVTKPGGMLLAFGGTRTHHRLMCAIEDAGWEIRDCLMYLYGTGFPKSHDYSKKLHQKAEQEAEHDVRFVRASYLSSPVYACHQCGQVLFSCVPKQGSQEYGTKGSEPQTSGRTEPSLERWCDLETLERELHRCTVCTMSHGLLADGTKGRVHHGAPPGYGQDLGKVVDSTGSGASCEPQSQRQPSGEPHAVSLERGAQKVRGWGTALKPAWEPIIVAMKPCDGTFAQNALTYGNAGLNIDECRIESETIRTTQGGIPRYDGRLGKAGNVERNKKVFENTKGRWPANVILDEEAGALLDEQSGIKKDGVAVNRNRKNEKSKQVYGDFNKMRGEDQGHGGSGGASRFFYCAKASKKERGEGNGHPTVKPLALMRWLCRLVKTPTGGKILDPFMGSGTTGVAAIKEGMEFVGIEQDDEHYETAKRRIENA